MLLKAIIEDQEFSLEVPDQVIMEGEAFFAKMDADMDQGWQMSRDWVANPSPVERCQIVGDKLLTALEKENTKLGILMAGYILTRLPGVESVTLDTHGEMQNSLFTVAANPATTPQATDLATTSFLPTPAPLGLNKFQAMEQAGNDITQVFKVGKGYRFSVYDHARSQWQDGPLVTQEADAERLRQAAFKARFESLQQKSG